MGVIAVFIGLIRREMTMEIVWDVVMRTLKSTGTIIWVTIGAAACGGLYACGWSDMWRTQSWN